MKTVVRVLPPGITLCARANSAADLEPGRAQRRVSPSVRGDRIDVGLAMEASARRLYRRRVFEGRHGCAGAPRASTGGLGGPARGPPLGQAAVSSLRAGGAAGAPPAPRTG